MDLELMGYVAEELEHLSKEWTQAIDEASLRRASAILRSLLIENKLPLAANCLNIEVRIMAPEDKGADLQLSALSFWQAGGAKNKGTQISSMFMLNRAMTDKEIAERANTFGQSQSHSAPVKIGSFLRQTSFIIEGQRILREDVIKYVANKLGGVHYDPKRKSDDSLEAKFILLDSMRGAGWQFSDKNAIYYELLSIGQLLINSRDIQRIRKTLTQIR